MKIIWLYNWKRNEVARVPAFRPKVNSLANWLLNEGKTSLWSLERAVVDGRRGEVKWRNSKRSRGLRPNNDFLRQNRNGFRGEDEQRN